MSLAALMSRLWWEVSPHQGDLARQLAMQGNMRAIALLVSILENDGPEGRRRAALTLGAVWHPDIIEPLARALQDPERRVASAAADALVGVGPLAAPALVRRLAHRDEFVRRQAAEALERLGWRPSITRERIYFALARRDWAAAAAEGTMVVRPLIRLLEDRADEVRRAAAQTLGTLGHPPAIAPLATALADRDPGVRSAAADALVRIGPASIRLLVQALGARTANERRLAVNALDALRWEPSNDAERAGRAIARRYWAAAIALGSEAAGPLVGLLGDPSPSVRANATLAIRALGDEALEALVEALRHPEWRVQSDAAHLIGEVAGREALPLLRERLRTSMQERDSATTGWLAFAIARLEARTRTIRGLPRPAEASDANAERLPRAPAFPGEVSASEA